MKFFPLITLPFALLGLLSIAMAQTPDQFSAQDSTHWQIQFQRADYTTNESADASMSTDEDNDNANQDTQASPKKNQENNDETSEDASPELNDTTALD